MQIHDAISGERRASVGSPLRPCGAFSGDESEEVLGGDRSVLQAFYRHYIEPYVILFEGFPEGAMFRAPLNQEILHPSGTEAMSDASRLDASQYLLDGRFVPRGIATPKGFVGCGPCTLGACMSARGPCFSLSGEVQKNAGEICAVGCRECSGPL